jgi:uncharacterized protein GlcG (DUF336 family)
MQTAQIGVRPRIEGLRYAMSLLCLIGTGVQAENVITNSTVSLEAAQRAAAESVRKCQADGYRVSATVVDRAGVTVAALRADGAGPHTLDSSRRKAYTSASLRETTQKMAALAAGSPELRGLDRMNDSILLLAGGFPIRIGGDVVGGIGVGGAPGGALDEACARAGLATLGADVYEAGGRTP